ncbi:hypothetical protein KDA00_04775 [Candidatus Saccharibacteria bacterium]|nr:hypothetical protein [Candidatus Saccharibacteria bacterium]
MSQANEGGALMSPNPMYGPGYDPELVECFADLVDDTIELSINQRSAQCTSDRFTQWCELDVISLEDPYILRTQWHFEFLRLMLRHDVIFSGDEAGDVYKLLLERGTYSSRPNITDSRSILMYVPEDKEEVPPVAVQTFAKDPLRVLFMDINDEEEVDYRDIVIGTKFAKQIHHDFYSMNRLTDFELCELYDELDVIYRALKFGKQVE